MHITPLGPAVDGTSISRSTLRPLVVEVRAALADTLLEMIPELAAEPPQDIKRVIRSSGPGSFETSIEAYQGIQTWISFRKRYADTNKIQQLDEIIRGLQPELLGYVRHSRGTMLIQDSFALCYCLSREATERLKESTSLEVAVTSVLADLDNILLTAMAQKETLTVLSGLKLPEGINRLDFTDSLYLRILTPEEITELGGSDVTFQNSYGLEHGFNSVALISEKQTTVSLSPIFEHGTHDFTEDKAIQEEISRVLEAIHIAKPGRVGVQVSFTTIRPSVLPNLSGYSTAPFSTHPFSFMELDAKDLPTVQRIYQALVSADRDELKIAAARLVDAESRLSPVDTLLDSVIGLEVLLNPVDHAELAFRTALNYAFLAPEGERRKRYDDVRKIQSWRNRVVHGGLNIQSKESSELIENANLAKDCLRDTIYRFLTDHSLAGNRKLTADFWLDRVIPLI